MSFLALCAFINRLGLEASSGYGVACKIVNFAMLIPSSLMQSMASFVSQNVGAGNEKRAKKAMFTGIGIGLLIGCVVFVLVLLKGDVLTGLFTTDVAVVQKGFEYLKGFAPETIATAVLFSMVGYFNGHDKTLLGYDPGTDADPSGETSYGLLYEYPAGCQSDEDWIGSTDGNCFRNRVKCWIFPVV